LGLVAGRPGALAETAEKLGRAARDIGFFYVIGHGIDPAFVGKVFAESALFFAEPVADKQALAISKSKHNRGYVGMKGESLDPTKPADLKEAFNIGWDLRADDARVLANEPFRGVNILDPVFRITSPQAIAMNLNLFRKFGKHAAILSK